MIVPKKVIVKNARGESFADVARRVGYIGDIPVGSADTDAEVLAALSSHYAEIAAAAGYSVIAPVRVATTANITLSGEQTIDGIAAIAGDRVLVKAQSSAAANGVYVVASGAWSRATDFDESSEAVTGSYVLVNEGDTNAGAWVLVTQGTITVGTTAQTWRVWRYDQIAQFISSLAAATGAGLSGYDEGETYSAGTVGKELQDISSGYQAADAATNALLKNYRTTNPVSLIRKVGQAHLRWITRSSGVSPGGGIPQGIAFDNVNRDFYELRGEIGTGLTEIARYRMDGPCPQKSFETQPGSALIGHQGVGVQNYPDGSVKLWGPGATDGQALRFTFNDGGAPTNVETFTFFSGDDASPVTICVSNDQRYLMARNYDQVIRVYLLDDLDTAGDYSSAALFEWTMTGFTYHLQVLASDGEFLYVLATEFSTSEDFQIVCYDIRDGTIIDRNLSVTVGKADLSNAGNTNAGGGTYYEGEGLAFAEMTPGRPSLVLNATGGDLARRRVLYYILDLGDPTYAMQRSDAILAAMDSFSPSSARRQLIRETVSEMVRYNIWDTMSCMWVLAAHAEGADLINWIDPGFNDLTRSGTGTGFTADAGIVGNNTDRCLILPGEIYGELVNYDKDRGRIKVVCDTNATAAGPAIGVEKGTYVRIDPNASTGNITSRMNSYSSLDVATGQGLSTPGIITLNRAGDISYVENSTGEYDLWKGDTNLKTVSQTFNTALSYHVVTLLRSDSTFANSDLILYGAALGRPLSDSLIQTENRIWKNYMAELSITLTL